MATIKFTDALGNEYDTGIEQPNDPDFDPPKGKRTNKAANARLIAAAPELLAALEWAVETADTEQYEADWYAAARAAIAKATASY